MSCAKENAVLPCMSALLLQLLVIDAVSRSLLFHNLLLTAELSCVLVEIDGSSARDFLNFKDPLAGYLQPVCAKYWISQCVRSLPPA